MRGLTLAALTLAASLALAGPPRHTPDELGPLFALGQQLEQDYVEAEEGHDPEGQDRQAALARTAAAQARAQRLPDVAALFDTLAAGMARHLRPTGFFATFRKIDALLGKQGGLPLTPAKPPDLALGAKRFDALCSSCHGKTGLGDTALAQSQEPPPENLQAADVVNHLSPWRIYVSIRWGVVDTAMPAYETLDDEERWAIAFYVLTLRQGECTGQPPPVPLAALATSTDQELSAKYTEAALPCLRRGAAR